MSRDHLSGAHAALIASGHCESHTTLDLVLLAGASRPVTADPATDLLSATAHGLADGQVVILRNLDVGGVLPKPFQPATVYFVRDATANSFKLAAAAGGAATDVTWAGAGATSVIPVTVLRYATAELTVGTALYLGKLLPGDGTEMSLLRSTDNAELKVSNVDRALGQTISGVTNALDGAFGTLGVVHKDARTGAVYYDQKMGGDVVRPQLDETADPPVVSFTLVPDIYNTDVTGRTFAEVFPYSEPAAPEDRRDPDDLPGRPGPGGSTGGGRPPLRGRYPVAIL